VYYGLDEGPQKERFGRKMIMENERTFNDNHNEDHLASSLSETLHLSNEPDRDVIEAILDFSIILMDKCANRSLYSSSDRLNQLLNTTSLPLLKHTLRLSVRLARRSYSAVTRNGGSANMPTIREGYHLNSQRLQVLALPSDPLTSPSPSQSPARGKEREHRKRSRSVSEDNSVHPWDLSAMLSGAQDSGDLRLSSQPEETSLNLESGPPSPLARRTSTMNSTMNSSMNGAIPDAESPTLQRMPTQNELVISFNELRDEDINATMEKISQTADASDQYKFLCRLREAKAIVSRNHQDRLDLVAIRLLALANFSFTQEESNVRQLIANPLSEHPRHYHLPQLIVSLVQPPESGVSEVNLELQTYALYALESLSIHKGIGFNMEVYYVLGANVNHGILFYLVRRTIAQLSEAESRDAAVTLAETEWREALFGLLQMIPQNVRPAAESLNQAGILEILNEVLAMRTPKAIKAHCRILQYLDSFIQSSRESSPTYININGLDVMKDLVAHTVREAQKLAEAGAGMPDEYRSHFTDYKIPFFHQSTLRWSFRIFNRLMANSGTTFNRQLRNLFDSRPMLQSLHKTLTHPRIFGSVVWSAAVNFLSSFLNNEPTSYSIIAEAGLNDAFLEVLQAKVPLTQLNEDHNGVSVRQDVDKKDEPKGSLPSLSDSIIAVPNGISALCLNEAGLKHFQTTDSIANFLDIFQSPPHVETLLDEGNGAQKLGGLFDELVRHHPHEVNGLKNTIVSAVLRMIENVDQRCRIEAYNYGYGAKAWLTSDNDQDPVVAGGQKSLRGVDTSLDEERTRYRQANLPQTASAKSDIEMQNGEQREPLDTSEPNPIVPHSVANENDSNMKVGYGCSMISAVVKFLYGFCMGTATRRAFLESGGVERLLDLLTSPCLDPANFFSNSMRVAVLTLHTDGSRLMSHLIEEQPYIVVPAILHRLDIALDVLKPLMSNESEQAFLAPLTTLPGSDTDIHPSASFNFEHGTFYMKALTIVQTLTSYLLYAFKEPSNSPRQVSGGILQQCNLSDMYVEVIEKLGNLSRSLIWEGVSLEAGLPASWKHGGLKYAAGPWNNIHTAETILADQGYAQPILETSDPIETHTAQYYNASILRYMYNKIPLCISMFFQNLGRLLLTRRTNHDLPRQAALRVADRIALSVKGLLEFAPAHEVVDEKLRCSYWVCVLQQTLKIFIDGKFNSISRRFSTNTEVERVNQITPLTLLLLAFKNQDGFKSIELIVDRLYDTYKEQRDSNTSDQLQIYRLGAMKLVLQLFSGIVDYRQVMDAPQTMSLQSARGPEKDKLDHFSTPQFMVELRLLAMHSIEKMWPNFIKDNEPYKPLMRLVRHILEKDGENGAFRRSDKVVQKGRTPLKLWSPRAPEQLQRLTESYGDELAREALYRCYDQPQYAAIYCAAHSRPELRNKRNPVPSSEMQMPGRPGNSPLPSISSAIRSTLEPSARDSSEPRSQTTESGSSSMNVENNDGDSPSLAATASTPDIFSGFTAVPDLQLPDMATFNAQLENQRYANASRIPPTQDDLDDKRKVLRDNLIANCSDILAERNDVNFELKEIINAASIDETWVQETDVGTQVLGMFASIADSMIETSDMEEKQQKAKQVGTITHFMALVLQERNIYEEKRDELAASLSVMLDLLTEPVNNFEDFVPQVLLLLELILSDDSQPVKIQWSAPKAADPIEAPGPIVSDHVRFLDIDEDEPRSKKLEYIMNAVLSLVPKVKGNEAFALSVVRVLSILTRYRELAVRMAKKEELKKFFAMLRQLTTMNELMQSCVLLILRHILEDDDVIRQIMRNEIESYFKTASRTPRFDTSQLTKHFANLVVRAPQLFVEVINELVQIHKWDTSKNTHYLELKKDVTVASVVTKEDPVSKSEEKQEQSKTDGSEKGVAETSNKDEAKDQPELKMPTLKVCEGLIGFMLQELLNIKDEDDSQVTEPAKTLDGSNDIDMTGSTTLQPEVASPAATSAVAEPSAAKEEKNFKAEDHPTFMYRSFLLQSLTELLSSYNKAKVEFITFRCRTDNQGTPSKPRATVFRYLLGNLIPVGTVTHESSISFKKREQTSQYAIALINGLVSKTFENGPYTTRETAEDSPLDLSAYIEEPELLYVRHIVVDQCIRALKEASEGSENLDMKYSRVMKISDLFYRILNSKSLHSTHQSTTTTELSQKMLAKIMYEKGLIPTLTNVLGDIDLKFTGAKRLVKYVLRPLKYLTEQANDLNGHPTVQSALDLADDDEDDGLFTEDFEEAFAESENPNIEFSSIGIYRPDEDEEDVEMESEDDDVDDYDEDDGEDYDEDIMIEDVVDDDENISDEDIDHDVHEEIDMGGGSDMDIDDDNLDMSDSDDDDGSSSSDSSDDLDGDAEDDDEDDDEDAQHGMEEAVIMNGPQGTWGEDEEDEVDDGNYDDVDDEVLHDFVTSLRQVIETNQVPQGWGEQGGHFNIESGLEEPPSLVTANDIAAATGFLDSFSQDNMVGDMSDVQVIDEDEMDEDEDDFDDDDEEGLIYHAGDDGKLCGEYLRLIHTKPFSRR
jgi:E3 ubiquitin-protein ligase HUWE1